MRVVFNREKAAKEGLVGVYESWARSCKINLGNPLKVIPHPLGVMQESNYFVENPVCSGSWVVKKCFEPSLQGVTKEDFM